jgi:hypothetical protein
VDIKENDNIQSVLDNSRNILHTDDVNGLSKSDDITKENFEVPGWPPEVSFNVTHYVDLDSLNTSLIVPTLREPISSKSKQKSSSRYWRPSLYVVFLSAIARICDPEMAFFWNLSSN